MKTATGASSTVSPSLPSDASSSDNISQFDDTKYKQYKNDGLNYSYALPKNSYYQGFGARNGATNTMAVSTTASGITDFETADVQVYYYKTEPANAPTYESVKLQNGGVLYISGATSGDPKITNIVNTITTSAK